MLVFYVQQHFFGRNILSYELPPAVCSCTTQRKPDLIFPFLSKVVQEEVILSLQAGHDHNTLLASCQSKLRLNMEYGSVAMVNN